MANSLEGGESGNSFDSYTSSPLIPPQPVFNKNGTPDTTTAPGLLNLAQQQGGAIAEQANALANPNSGILSTISNGFKNGFSDFVKAISLPSNVVAGVIAGAKGENGEGITGNVVDAIKNGTDPYTAIFGKNLDPNETTMQKVGGFVARTATDILLDPLTYVTFGAGEGIFGLRATSEIPLFGDAAKSLSVEEGSKVALNDSGQAIYSGTKSAENFYKANVLQMGHEQALGTTMGKFFQTGDAALNASGEQLKSLLNASIDMPASSVAAKDFTKKALSNLFTQAPQLAETYLDKGGLKLFGQTVLEGARIRNAVAMIPGMTTIDNVTAPVRNMVSALFDPSLVKVNGEYVRLPEEFMDMKNLAMSTLTGKQNSIYQSMFDLAKAHGLNTQEVDLVTAALDANKMPADTKLAKAFLDAKGISPAEYQVLAKNGIPVSHLDGHVIPHVSIQDDVPVRKIPFKTPPSTTTGASEHATLAKFIEQGGSGFEASTGAVAKTAGEDTLEKLPGEVANLRNVKGGTGLIDKIAGAKSVQEAGFAVGEHLNSAVNDLTKDGDITFEKALQHPDVKALHDTRNAIDALPQSKQLVGDPEKLGLTKADDLGKTFTDASGKTYARRAAGLDELAQAGFKNFDTNFYTAHLSRMLDNAKAVTMNSFVSDAAREFGKVASAAPQGWTTVGSSALNKAAQDVFKNVLSKDGEQILFHPAIAKYLEDFSGKVINDEPTSDVLKAFDKIQNAWKASVTSIFPAFHGRNALTHVINNALDLGYEAFNPTTHFMAASFVRDDLQVSGLATKALGTGEGALQAKNDLADLLNKVMFTDNTGKDWTTGEIRQMVKDNGVAFGHVGAGGPEDISLTNAELAQKMQGSTFHVASKVNPFSQDFLPYEVGRNVGSAMANQARMVNFIANLKNTGDVELAAARTKQFLFDYGNLTNFEKTFAKRMIPFYTFTRKNLELQVQSLLHTPGRIAGEVTSLQNLGDVISGNNKLSPAEQAALPDWIKTGLYSVTAKDGENVSVQSGFASPVEQPFAALQPNAILGSLSPIIGVPLEQATGYSFFQGKPLSQVTNATAFKDAPGFIQNMIGFTSVKGVDSSGQPYTYYVSLRPEMMNLLLNLPPTSRVFSSLKQIETVDPSSQAGIMQQLIGTHPYNFNLSVEAQRQENTLRDQLQSLLDNAHVTASFSRSFIPKNQASDL